MNYDISIIIPFYNGNKYLKRLFNCLEKNIQSASMKVEVILVNDSPDIEVEVPEHNFELRILKNEVNSGIHYSRTQGIKASNSQYILMLDQDDLLFDGALESQYQAIEKIQGDMIISNGQDENPLNKGVIYHSHEHMKLALNLENYFYVGCMIVSPGQCLIKKEAIPQEWLEFSIKQNGTDDLLLWVLMFKQNKKIDINDQELYIHTYNGENVSADFNQMKQSVKETIQYLVFHQVMTKDEEKIYYRRLNMRQFYEGKSKIKKLIACFLYPKIAWRLYKIKKS